MSAPTELERVSGMLGEPFDWPGRGLLEACRDEFPKYFWFSREGRETDWACEACGSAGTLRHPQDDVPRHGRGYRCPACCSEGEARNERISRKGMREDMLATDWQRAGDGETLIARTWYVVLDRSAGVMETLCDGYEPPWRAEPYAYLWGVNIINMRSRTAQRWERKNLRAWDGPEGPWVRRRKRGSSMGAAYGRFVFAKHALFGINFEGRMDEALEGTDIGGAWGAIAEEFAGGEHSPDLVREMGNLAADAQIEYMIKGGLIDLAVRATAGQALGPLVNRRGRTLSAMLRMPAHEIKWARKQGVEIDLDYLKMRERLERAGMGGGWQPAEIAALAEQVGDWAWREMMELIPAGMRRRALRYTLRRTDGRNGHPARIFGDLVDYWRDSRRLGRDLSDEREALPRDLPERHAADQRRIRYMTDEKQEAAIAALVPRWERRYGFSWDGLVLRPAYSGRELIAEGERQRICVGSYVGRYASGETVIMLLRERERLEQPWRTVEISPATGRVVQDRGYMNDARGIPRETKERLAAFWAAFAGRETA